MKNSRAKLFFLWITSFLNGAFMCALPFVSSFGLLGFLRIMQFVSLGAYITVDASMLVYTMGPIKSRPFTNALHAAVGAGFLIGTFLVRPFLPEDATAAADREQVCRVDGGADDGQETKFESELVWGVSKIAWPFLITGFWCVIVSFGYFALGKGFTLFCYLTSTGKFNETKKFHF